MHYNTNNYLSPIWILSSPETPTGYWLLATGCWLLAAEKEMVQEDGIEPPTNRV